MIRLDVTVDDITEVMAAGYTVIRVYTDTSEDGEFTTLDGTETLVAGQSGYSYVDTDGTTATWYETAYYGASPGEGSKSAAQQGGTLDAYCTALDVRKELAMASGQVAIGAEHDDTVWDMCVQASRLIDRYKDVEEGAYLASGSEVRYFDGSGTRWLWLDAVPAVSISTVEVEETDGTWTEWASTDYYEYPYNSTPVRRLDVNAKTDGDKGAWTAGRKRVRVTAVWGIATTPPALIERACRIQVARWFKRAMQGWADAGGQAEMGILRYVQRLDPDVEVILERAEPRRVIF